jgi:hypothetical protein
MLPGDFEEQQDQEPSVVHHNSGCGGPKYEGHDYGEGVGKAIMVIVFVAIAWAVHWIFHHF